MTAFLKKWWFVGLLLLPVLYVITCHHPKSVPIPVPQSTIELAAQHAASAIVAVKESKAVHVQHVATIAHVDSAMDLPADIDAQPLSPALNAKKDTVIAELKADAVRLDSALTTATKVLVTDTTVRIPQDSTPAIKGPSLGSKIGKAILSNVTVGYGATYDGKTFSAGPTVGLGLHLTSGVVGVTAGVTATYAAGTVHAGVGATVGVRL